MSEDDTPAEAPKEDAPALKAEAPVPTKKPWGPRVVRALVGAQPRAFAVVLIPTLCSLVVDAILRARAFVDFAPQGKAIYGSSLLVSMGFWMLPLWGAARLFRVEEPRRRVARIALAALVALWLLPFATFAYGGQLLYYRVFHAYMGRDSIRLGVAVRGTVRDWFGAWGGSLLFLAMIAIGALVLAVTLRAVHRRRESIAVAMPAFPIVLFGGALFCFWTDNVDSRFLQAATPDTCFTHGVVHAFRMAVTGKWNLRTGVSMRTPAPLPDLRAPGGEGSARPPNVIVILTESVRADALCSDPPPRCKSAELDDAAVAGDRIPLGKLTAETPNTFSAAMILFTGLPANAEFRAAHSAPVLFELARARGHKTAYVTSQNPNFEDFGAYFRRAGIDTIVTANDLGGMGQEQLGAPDERAIARANEVLRDAKLDERLFLVLHLSNTHAPYRSDPAITPFLPESRDPIADPVAFHNHYGNSVAMQSRMIADFIRGVRASAAWDDTVVVFLSDHGEQFREHGGLYHNHSLYDEELRVPGFMIAGARALTPEQRFALVSYSGQRTYTEDVHETVVDLLGLEDARATLPFASDVNGRSLLRRRDASRDPIALFATSTAVWEPDDARFGVAQREKKLWGAPGLSWSCYDMRLDPRELRPLPAAACGADLAAAAKRAFPDAFTGN
jgi:hypothetical protein